MKSSLLIDDLPLQLLPRLAVLIGLNEAVVLQQVHFLLRVPNSGRVMNGLKWIWNTYEAWQEQHFPFWSVRTLKTVIAKLEKAKLLISCQPDGRMSRKKYYRVNYEALERLNRDRADLAPSKVQKLHDAEGAKVARSKTETSSEKSGTETSRKEERCSATSRRSNIDFQIPSEPEIQKFIAEHKISIDAARAWYHNNSKRGWKAKGKFRIYDWRKTLLAYGRNFKKRTHDTLSDSDLHTFCEEQGIDDERFDTWIDWGNRNKWMRKNRITGFMEPIFDLKASLLAFDAHIDNCMPTAR